MDSGAVEGTAASFLSAAHQIDEEGLSSNAGDSLDTEDDPVLDAAAVVVAEQQREHHKHVPAEQQHRHLYTHRMPCLSGVCLLYKQTHHSPGALHFQHQ